MNNNINSGLDSIVLGSAQFGLNYGVSNLKGRPSLEDINKILIKAKCSGIKLIDTAPIYGDTEVILGKFIKKLNFGLITKTFPISNSIINDVDVNKVQSIFEESLIKLGINQAEGLIVHQAEDLLKIGSDKLYKLLSDLKKKQVTNKIGVSVYSPREAEIITSKYPIDLIQLPFNIVDQRAYESGLLERLSSRGVEVHARSVFLQGALLMDPNFLPSHLMPLAPAIIKMKEIYSKRSGGVHGACLKFVTETSGIDKVVCGVNSLIELEQLIGNYHSSHENFDYSLFAIDDPLIINPSNWPKRDT